MVGSTAISEGRLCNWLVDKSHNRNEAKNCRCFGGGVSCMSISLCVKKKKKIFTRIKHYRSYVINRWFFFFFLGNLSLRHHDTLVHSWLEEHQLWEFSDTVVRTVQGLEEVEE